MKLRWRIVAILAAGVVQSCANPDAVLFVTDTSIGINVDSSPPTASIAYDRTEGYIAPRYQNGALPPVVASLSTGGTVFAPKIRQVYATGAAALKAVGTTGNTDGPDTLSGDPTQKRLVFFGTNTTLGLKVGFSASGAPDSMVFGYKRKELSFIPLASMPMSASAAIGAPTGTNDIYPSVLASIDTTVASTSLSGTGLDSTQFFATGKSAETLAKSSAITKTFSDMASTQLSSAALTPDQMKSAQAVADKQTADTKDHLGNILDYVAPGGTVDSSKLGHLVDDTNKTTPGTVPEALKSATTTDAIKKRVGSDQFMIQKMYEAIPAAPGK